MRSEANLKTAIASFGERTLIAPFGPVHAQRRVGFLREVERCGRLLHESMRRLDIRHPRLCLNVVRAKFRVSRVHIAKHEPLQVTPAHRLDGALQVCQRRRTGDEACPCVKARQEIRPPTLMRVVGFFRREDDERGQIGVECAEAVPGPRAETWMALQDAARVHLDQRRPVRECVAVQRFDDCQFVHMPRQHRQRVADLLEL